MSLKGLEHCIHTVILAGHLVYGKVDKGSLLHGKVETGYIVARYGIERFFCAWHS